MTEGPFTTIWKTAFKIVFPKKKPMNIKIRLMMKVNNLSKYLFKAKKEYLMRDNLIEIFQHLVKKENLMKIWIQI